MIVRRATYGHRTERTTAVARGIVALLVGVHVLLVADALDAAGLFGVGIAAVALLLASTVAGAISTPPGRRTARESRDLLGWAVAAADALALVAVARITVDVDPTATLAWTFVLWVPFSIAVRQPPLRAAAGTAAVALLVLAAAVTRAGPLDSIGEPWAGIAVPMLLVAFAGAATIFATVEQRRSGNDARRRLRSEQDRALRLIEADDLKNTFLAAVSHELRTPLTSIIGFSMTLVDRPDLGAEQRETMLRLVLREAEEIEELIANLLDLDRLTRGRATLVRVPSDPARIVDAAIAAVERRSGRRVERRLEPGLRIDLDVPKVERIVANLVGNAVKYTPSDADVLVEVRALDDGSVRIRVDDSGPGIADELRATIFEPFRRGADVGVPGTGIGLSLVDRFSRMHGGRARVTDGPDGGCRFEVVLPPTDMSVESRGLRSGRGGVSSST